MSSTSKASATFASSVASNWRHRSNYSQLSKTESALSQASHANTHSASYGYGHFKGTHFEERLFVEMRQKLDPCRGVSFAKVGLTALQLGWPVLCNALLKVEAIPARKVVVQIES